jgi:hypothetical protein
LLKSVEAEGIYIIHHARLHDADPRGDYRAASDDCGPVIRIFHPERYDQVVEPDDTITLAIVYGYHRSHLAHEHTDRYTRAINVPFLEWKDRLSPEDRREVLRMVERSCAHGRAILEAAGFTAWAAFEEHVRDNVKGHRRYLGI